MIQSKKVCLFCEKPSQAAHWAEALGGSKNAMHGTYKGQAYVITASHGFLFELKQPDEMVTPGLQKQVKDWDIKNLPWDDKWFKWSYHYRPGSSSTAKAMAAAAKGCDEICIAGDLDPQGTGFEIEALNIIETGCERSGVKFTRAEFGDESVKELRKGFEKRYLVPDLRKNAEWLQSVTRERFDMLSMQWTRVLSGSVGKKRVTLRTGRLKGAIVRLVGEQEDAVKNYVKKTVYQASFVDENGIKYIDDKQPTFEKKGDVPLGGLRESAVVVDSKMLKRTAPPKLLDLAGLSGKLAKEIGPKQLLQIYQSLYDAKICSYPRTEDTKITPEQKAELMPLVPKIAAVVGVDARKLTHTADRPTHVGSGMAHGANRPGPVVPDSLEALDAQFGRGAGLIYETLARSFLAMLAEDATYDAYKAHVKDFPSYVGRASVPVSRGWRDVFDDGPEETDAKGPGEVAKPAVRSITNPKPVAPNQDWLFKKLAKYDVGTGATRTSTLAEVCDSHAKFPLMTNRRGKLALTDNGRMEYVLLKDTHIADLDLTARLYQQMKDVAKGKLTTEDVTGQVAGLVADDIKTVEKNAKDNDLWGEGAGNIYYEGTTVLGKQVRFKRTWSGHTFTEDECKQLLAGDTIAISAVRSDGSSYDVKGTLEQQTYKGVKFWGFKPQFSSAGTSADYVEGTWKRKHVRFKRKWSDHVFTADEIDELLKGHDISFEAMSRAGRPYTVTGKLANQTYNGHKYVGFKPDFGH